MTQNDYNEHWMDNKREKTPVTDSLPATTWTRKWKTPGRDVTQPLASKRQTGALCPYLYSILMQRLAGMETQLKVTRTKSLHTTT